MRATIQQLTSLACVTVDHGPCSPPVIFKVVMRRHSGERWSYGWCQTATETAHCDGRLSVRINCSRHFNARATVDRYQRSKPGLTQRKILDGIRNSSVDTNAVGPQRFCSSCSCGVNGDDDDDQSYDYRHRTRHDSKPDIISSSSISQPRRLPGSSKSRGKYGTSEDNFKESDTPKARVTLFGLDQDSRKVPLNRKQVFKEQTSGRRESDSEIHETYQSSRKYHQGGPQQQTPPDSEDPTKPSRPKRESARGKGPVAPTRIGGAQRELVDHEWRILWRAARDYQQTDHYDYSLFGLSTELDRAVAQHQRETMLYNQDRHLKEEQAKQVAPNLRQSPIAIMSLNPAYELQNKPLVIQYPATVENLRLNNTGFSWEVKIPYQISMTTALYGAHLAQTQRFRLDQFHCHWGESDDQGSEHTIDNRCYSAEMHFVHYNMEKYHTMSKAARHPDGLVVLSVFLDAQENHLNHAELDKIVSNLKTVQLKGEHSIIKQAIRIENLLPANRSYWSYQGSLTTPPYLESVTWFILKHPIKCNTSQIQRFRNLKSTPHHDDDQIFIKSNFRKTQPLNGRSVVMYDEPVGSNHN